MARDFRRMLRYDPHTYYYMLSNGATPLETFRLYLRRTLAKQRRRLTAQGKIFVVALLLGLLAGGTEPIKAFLLAIAITAGILLAAALLAVALLWINFRRASDDNAKLKQDNGEGQ